MKTKNENYNKGCLTRENRLPAVFFILFSFLFIFMKLPSLFWNDRNNLLEEFLSPRTFSHDRSGITRISNNYNHHITEEGNYNDIVTSVNVSFDTKHRSMSENNGRKRKKKRRKRNEHVENEASIQPQTKSLKSTRIIGGTPAGNASLYPFIVALYKQETPGEFYPICGGSMITPRVILTAAHCADKIKSAEVSRYDLSHDTISTSNTLKIEKFQIVEKRVHPNYNADNYDNDYALLKIDRDHPNPYLVSLRKTSEIPGLLTIMGWGLTSSGGDPKQSMKLLHADVKREDDDSCRRSYATRFLPITENMFCARDEGIDSCQGDSGGPIVVKNTNIQVGVISWGIDCAKAQYPGVYARIDKAHAWIESILCEENFNSEQCINERLPLIKEDGTKQRAQESAICDDLDVFRGLGKKMKTRTCGWVGKMTSKRCR